MIAHIRRLWAGEAPLADAFWRYAVAYGVLINLLTSALFLALYVAEASPLLLVPVYLLPTPYNVLAVVAVWRSANRYQGPRKWADLARLATLIGMIVLTLT